MTWPIHIIVPMTPESVNVYVRHCVIGGRIRRFKGKSALAFEEAGRNAIRGERIEAKAYAVRIEIHLGKGRRGDVDNFLKQPLDLLTKCGVIHSDAAITDLHITKHRDIERPRCEIWVRAND